MPTGRIVIIPFLQGKLAADGTLIEPDIDDILAKWMERHPEFQGPERDYRVIRAKMHIVDGVATSLVRVTAEHSEDLADYGPTEDADLYEQFLVPKDESAPMEPHKIWIEQCEAAENIEDEFGTQKALDYLVGEKFLNFNDYNSRLLRAFFQEDLDIGQIDVLTKLAGEVGLDEDTFRRALETSKYRDSHQTALRHAQDMGITAVPAFKLGEHLLPGLQQKRTIEKAIELALDQP